ncbi:hypothetical protein V6Z05_15105 [Leptospira venezuelensis]|uniref:hypothetical protein n=1 Tax=Leptospira venezuelensis TaxID=1958811 RepID=UPI0012FFD185|nr:hypothetical protein [Leptospira venezuelensis]
MIENKCYFCGKEATSREHVPPQCLFPQKEKSELRDLKRNLITVPSCDVHNSNKSHDDEYLKFILTTNIRRNSHSINQFNGKVLRGINRDPKKYATFLLHPKRVLIYDPKNRKTYSSLSYKIDTNRMQKIIELISYGLYYHDYKDIFFGSMEVILNGAIFGGDRSANLNNELFKLEAKMNSYFNSIIDKGENPEIFKYSFLELSNSDYLLRIVFYETFTIIVLLNSKLESSHSV